MLRLHCGAVTICGTLLIGVSMILESGCSRSSTGSQPVAKAPPPAPHNHVEQSLQAGIKNGPKPKVPVILNNGFDPSKQVAVASDTVGVATQATTSSTETAEPEFRHQPRSGSGRDTNREGNRRGAEGPQDTRGVAD